MADASAPHWQVASSSCIITWIQERPHSSIKRSGDFSSAMADPSVNLCIAGCGGFARAHAKVAYRKRDVVVMSFASRSKEKAEAYARRYGGPQAFGSYEEAARDPEVDAFLFCTPHSLHRENLELAADWGKHVLMEKPIATTLEDACAMRDRAREASIRLMVAENYRYMPTLQAAAELIRKGTIGELRALHVQFTKYQSPTDWRLSRAMMGGGAFIDGGIHKVAALRTLAGDPHTVSAVASKKVFPEMEGEEAISLWATFPGGVVGTINYSWAAVGEPGTHAFLAIGSEGCIQFDFYGSSLQILRHGREDTITVDGDHDGLGAQLDAFLDLVVTGKRVAASPEEGIGDLRVVLAAYASMESGGRPVKVENGSLGLSL